MTDIHVFHCDHFPKAPFCIGRKGVSWFLCFARPYGAVGNRMHACLNQVHPSLPFPSELRQGQSKFVFDSCGPNAEILQSLLNVEGQPLLRKTGITFGSEISELPEVEILIPSARILRCCAHCNKWEAIGMPRFQVCSGCKLRYYCSQECQMADWKPSRHKGDCRLLKEGKEGEIEARRQTHDNNWWINKMLREPKISYDDAEALFDDFDYRCYGAR